MGSLSAVMVVLCCRSVASPRANRLFTSPLSSPPPSLPSSLRSFPPPSLPPSPPSSPLLRHAGTIPKAKAQSPCFNWQLSASAPANDPCNHMVEENGPLGGPRSETWLLH